MSPVKQEFYWVSSRHVHDTSYKSIFMNIINIASSDKAIFDADEYEIITASYGLSWTFLVLTTSLKMWEN
jgi:hypothetical protein